MEIPIKPLGLRGQLVLWAVAIGEIAMVICQKQFEGVPGWLAFILLAIPVLLLTGVAVSSIKWESRSKLNVPIVLCILGVATLVGVGVWRITHQPQISPSLITLRHSSSMFAANLIREYNTSKKTEEIQVFRRGVLVNQLRELIDEFAAEGVYSSRDLLGRYANQLANSRADNSILRDIANEIKAMTQRSPKLTP